MKRFLAFSGYDYYPGGGWGDFVGDYDTEAEAKQAIEGNTERQWAHVVDTETGREVAEGDHSWDSADKWEWEPA